MSTAEFKPLYLIVGAGRIGQAMLRLLEEKEKDVVMVDTVKEAIELRNSPTFVIAALPYKICLDAAMWCAQKSVPVYIDFTEDAKVRSEVEKLANVYTNTCFIPCCGLAPGYVNIIAGRMMRSLEHVNSVKIYCGALPSQRTEDYKISWNVEGLINLYTSPCEVVTHGLKRYVEALSSREVIRVGGVEYEAACTSGGLGTMTDKDNLPATMYYKTLRYAGHYDIVSTLINKFKLCKDDLVKIFSNLPKIGWDKVVIKIEVNGVRQVGISVSSNITLSHEEAIFPEKGLTALQYATAKGAMIALESNEIWTKKFIKQEDL